MIEGRIIIDKCIHRGKELDCYIPQVFVNGQWRDILSKECYIIKEGHNPLIICKKCFGNGRHCYLQTDGSKPNYMDLIYENSPCKECNGIGLRKGEQKDNIEWAKTILDKEIAKIEKYLLIKNKYSL